jgi:hypothetical protein
MVDGAARSSSVLVLSHWPQSPTPPALARDLSAQIVFAFLHLSDDAGSVKAPGLGRPQGSGARAALAAAGRAEAVTNDHFDEDGFVSLLAMTDPETALRYEELLVEVASCGDFGVVRSREAARIAFAISPIGEEVAGTPPLGAPERPGSFSGARYRAVLERAGELVEHPEHFRRYWEEADAAYAVGRGDIEAGRVVLEALPEVDLALVRRLPGAGALNSVALHSATAASRVLVFDGGRCELYLRYEGWVRYVSREVPLRPDLAPLADELSAAERSGARWESDGVGSLVSAMRSPAGGTDLEPAFVTRTVVEYLRHAPVAWDPFRPAGALVPVGERRVRRQRSR